MTLPKFIIVPGDRKAKSLAKRQTRLYLPNGTEIPCLESMTLECPEPVLITIDGPVRAPRQQLRRISLELGPNDVRQQAKPPRKRARRAA